MNATNRLLDAVKARLGLKTDYQLAKHCVIGQQVLSRYRRGGHTLGDEKAIEFDELIGADPVVALLEVQAERAEIGGRERMARVLREGAKRAARVVVMMIAYIVGMSAAGLDCSASAAAWASMPTGYDRQLLVNKTHYATFDRLLSRIKAWISCKAHIMRSRRFTTAM